jgi:rhodanese-related sulfurtransferase
MVHGRGRSIFAVTLICFLLYTGTEIALANGAPRISKEELRAMLGNPDLIIVDARTSGSWEESKVKIQGAVREDPKYAKSWAEKYSKDKTIVLYCA